MKTLLQENKGLPASLLWTLAIIAGISVANLYYNQPLLNRISEDLEVTEFVANLIPMTTQIGYAAGLLFIIPLGDLYSRRIIIAVNFLLLSVSMFGIGMAQDIRFILPASLVTGICSVMPQIFIPIASQFSEPEKKAQNVGFILSGLLTGILGSRVIAGIVGEYWGWRTIFFIASTLMLVSLFIVLRILPEMPSNFKGTYWGLMKSVFTLVGKNATLRMVSVRAGFCFGSFLTLWACLAFKMSGEPFHAGNNIIGLLGLCGMAGALTASVAGKYVRRYGVRRFNYIGSIIMIASWILLYICQNSYIGIITGIITIDIGMQCIQISNQTCALSLVPQASNRVNTIFMTTYFIGGSLGTFLAGTFWHHFGWTGVTGVGICLAGISLLITLFGKH